MSNEVFEALALLHARVDRLEQRAQLSMIPGPSDEFSNEEISAELKKLRPSRNWEFKVSRVRENRWMIRVTFVHKSGGAASTSYELMYYPREDEFSVDETWFKTIQVAAENIWRRAASQLK
jgi:hypothetical protein